MRIGVFRRDSENALKLLTRLRNLPQLVDSEILIRPGQFRIQRDGELVISIRFIDLTKFHFGDTNQIVDRGIFGRSACAC